MMAIGNGWSGGSPYPRDYRLIRLDLSSKSYSDALYLATLRETGGIRSVHPGVWIAAGAGFKILTYGIV
jgi:hypothetical protein